MADIVPLHWAGYVPAAKVACAFKNGEAPQTGDWAGVALHAVINAAVIGGVSKIAGADNKRAILYGAAGATGLYLTLLGMAYYEESCKEVKTTTTTTEVVLLPKEIKVSQQIFFDTDKATIKPVSLPVIDEVARVMKENPAVTIEIQGHTDNAGTADYNKTLSQNRANSVMAYLVSRGILPTRMTAKGYGLEVPIASNATEAGRSQNRRVQFMRTDSASIQTAGYRAGR